jgi:centromere protein I
MVCSLSKPIAVVADPRSLASRTPAKQRKTQLRPIVDSICDTAFENGLPRSALDVILNIITLPNHLDIASVGKLVRSLYPATKVHDGAVTSVIGCLGQGETKPAAQTQAALLRWLIQVFEMMDNRGIVARFYGVLFNLLSTYHLRFVLYPGHNVLGLR